MNEKVIILGNDHANTVGLIHSLGRCGVYTIVVVWGKKTGMVPASKYVSEFYGASTPQDCMDLIIEKFGNAKERFVIIPACDGAAGVIEDYRNKLSSNFLFQHIEGPYSLRELQNKDLQVSIAEKSGFNIPKSWDVDTIDDIPSDIVFPCIIKARVAGEGGKACLLVCKDMSSLKTNLEFVFARTPRVLVQQYIEKDFDFDVMGCRFSNGEVYIPICLKKLGLYPPKVGLATVSESMSVPDDIIKAATEYMKMVDYYGIFDFEYMHSMIDGKRYFIECNFRNSGCNAFALKSGYNLPLYHYQDLIGVLNNESINRADVVTRYFIREYHYYNAVRAGMISWKEFISDFKKCNGTLTYYKDDKKPFYRQFTNKIRGRFGKSGGYY